MDTPRSSWFAQAEDAIRALRDIDSATVLGEGEVIREIHVLKIGRASCRERVYVLV